MCSPSLLAYVFLPAPIEIGLLKYYNTLCFFVPVCHWLNIPIHYCILNCCIIFKNTPFSDKILATIETYRVIRIYSFAILFNERVLNELTSVKSNLAGDIRKENTFFLFFKTIKLPIYTYHYILRFVIYTESNLDILNL